MELEFDDEELDGLSRNESSDHRFPPGIGRIFRKRIQYLRASPDERALYAMNSLNYEQLKGKRKGEYSVRLNQQYRIVFRYTEGKASKKIIVMSVEDYH